MDAQEGATTATAMPAAFEGINVSSGGDVQSLMAEAAASKEPKQEVAPAAVGTAAALEAPASEQAEAPAATSTAQPAAALDSADAAAGPAVSEVARSADERADAGLVVAPAPAAQVEAQPAAAEAAQAEATTNKQEPPETFSTAAAADSAVHAAATGSSSSSQEQKEQDDAAVSVADTPTAARTGAIAGAGSEADTVLGSRQDRLAAPAAPNGIAAEAGDEGTAAEAGDEGTAAAGAASAAKSNDAAARVPSPAAGTVAAAKAHFLRSQTPDDPATGAAAQAPLGRRGSRASSTGGGTRISSNGELVLSGAALDDTDEAALVKVRELREQLSATHPHLTGGVMPPSAPPSPREEKGPLPLLSEHDKVNTVNAAELLRTAEFKLVPGTDRVPYEELIKLRLEDGVDVTRKEEYLSDEDFKAQLGVDRDAYQKLPQWKKLQLKKAKMLF